MVLNTGHRVLLYALITWPWLLEHVSQDCNLYSLVMAPFKQTKQTTFRSRTKTGEKIPEACLLWAAWCHCRDNQPRFSFPAAFFWKAWKLFFTAAAAKIVNRGGEMKWKWEQKEKEWNDIGSWGVKCQGVYSSSDDKARLTYRCILHTASIGSKAFGSECPICFLAS